MTPEVVRAGEGGGPASGPDQHERKGLVMRARLSMFSLFLALALAGGMAVGAQPEGATPVAGGQAGVLAQAIVDEMPGPDAEVWLLRFTMDPGGSMPEMLQIGPVLISVESGAITLTSDQPPGAMQGDQACQMATPMMPGMGNQRGMGPMHGTPGADCPFGTPMANCPSGGPVANCPFGTPVMDPARAQGDWTLTAGDSVLVPENATLGVANEGDTGATYLALMVFTGEREGEAAQDQVPIEPVGVTTTAIAVGVGTFGSGPYVMTIDRALVEAAATMEGGVAGGFELGAVEAGSAAATFSTGSSYIWPGLAGSGETNPPSGERTPVDARSTLELGVSDSYAISDGTMTWTAGPDPVSILRAIIAPA